MIILDMRLKYVSGYNGPIRTKIKFGWHRKKEWKQGKWELVQASTKNLI